MRQKTCKACGLKFTPARSLQSACSPECAWSVGKEIERKRKAKAHREAKQKAKTMAQWLKEAQAAFNAWIRHRDREDPCISCGRYHQGQWHAGHYRSVGAAPELRFDVHNAHKQCQPCNTHKSGNVIEYRINLIKKIGIEEVERLEGKHEARHYTIDDCKRIIVHCRNLLKS